MYVSNSSLGHSLLMRSLLQDRLIQRQLHKGRRNSYCVRVSETVYRRERQRSIGKRLNKEYLYVKTLYDMVTQFST